MTVVITVKKAMITMMINSNHSGSFELVYNSATQANKEIIVMIIKQNQTKNQFPHRLTKQN